MRRLYYYIYNSLTDGSARMYEVTNKYSRLRRFSFSCVMSLLHVFIMAFSHFLAPKTKASSLKLLFLPSLAIDYIDMHL